MTQKQRRVQWLSQWINNHALLGMYSSVTSFDWFLMKLDFTSICLVFVCILHSSCDLSVMLSQWKVTGYDACGTTSRSWRSQLNQMASCVVVEAATHSAFMVDNATTDYFLLHRRSPLFPIRRWTQKSIWAHLDHQHNPCMYIHEAVNLTCHNIICSQLCLSSISVPSWRHFSKKDRDSIATCTFMWACKLPYESRTFGCELTRVFFPIEQSPPNPLILFNLAI